MKKNHRSGAWRLSGESKSAFRKRRAFSLREITGGSLSVCVCVCVCVRQRRSFQGRSTSWHRALLSCCRLQQQQQLPRHHDVSSSDHPTRRHGGRLVIIDWEFSSRTFKIQWNLAPHCQHVLRITFLRSILSIVECFCHWRIVIVIFQSRCGMSNDVVSLYRRIRRQRQ